MFQNCQSISRMYLIKAECPTILTVFMSLSNYFLKSLDYIAIPEVYKSLASGTVALYMFLNFIRNPLVNRARLTYNRF